MLNSILLSLLSGFYWLNSSERKLLKDKLLFLSAMLIIPLSILAISTAFNQKCPIDDGFYFYLILTVPSVFIGISISLFSRFISARFRYFIFLVIWLIMLLGFLPELYFNPQIYFYNAIFGYFPGVIYDHTIKITQEIILYRFTNLILALLVIYLLSRDYDFKKITKLIVITAFISSYLHCYEIKASLGLSTDMARIENELKSEIHSENFRIIVPDSINERERQILIYEHEFYFQSINNLLGSSPTEKIVSILFESGAQKKSLFGSGNADVAKPWLNQVYLDINNYSGNLKHEIAHIFSAEFGSGPLKIPPDFNPGIIEGFAMAVEDNYNGVNINYLAALAYKNDYKISLEALFTDFSFFTSASSLSYIYAGSFFKFLADEYDWDSIEKIYSGQSFESIFNNSFEILETEFYDHLEGLNVNLNVHSANYYFGYRPLVKRFCARTAAKQLREGNRLFNDKYFEEAAEIYFSIYNYSDSYSSLVGYINSLKEIGDIDTAVDLLSKELKRFEGSSAYYYLEFILADFFAMKNDSSRAVDLYNKILDQNPHRVYSRNAAVNKTLLEKGDSLLLKYLKSSVAKKQIITRMLKEEPNDYFAEQYISLAENMNLKYETVLENLLNAGRKIEFSSQTSFRLSKYSYYNLDIPTAIYYAEKSLQNVEKCRKGVIYDHYLKLRWISDQN